MVRFVLLLGAVIAMAAPSPAQIEDGDLVASHGNLVVSVNLRTGRWSTMMAAALGVYPAWIRMTADNRDVLMILGAYSSTLDHIVRMDRFGGATTVITMPRRNLGALALDHDDTWIVPDTEDEWTRLLAMDRESYQLRTLFQKFRIGSFRRVVIDREPSATPYLVANDRSDILGCDRQGIVSTIFDYYTLDRYNVAVDEIEGGFLVINTSGGDIFRLDRLGRTTSLNVSIRNASAMRFRRSGGWWISHILTSSVPAVSEIDRDGKTVRTYAFNGLTQGYISECEVFGGRKLVCRGSGKPGTAVDVIFQSDRTADRNASYAFACSFGRRPAVRFSNGEWLTLAQDPLFAASTSGLLPAVFERFRGQTSAAGTAYAKVHLPANLPTGLGLTVFVAGITFTSAQVHTVTNTHWFEID